MAVTNAAAPPRVEKGFTCIDCGVWHSDGDRGKSGSPGETYCRACAHGLTNRKDRRRNKHLLCTTVKCWQKEPVMYSSRGVGAMQW